VPSVIDTGSSLIDGANVSAFRKAAASTGLTPKALAWLNREWLPEPIHRH
jgi:hypothetical protein